MPRPRKALSSSWLHDRTTSIPKAGNATRFRSVVNNAVPSEPLRAALWGIGINVNLHESRYLSALIFQRTGVQTSE